MAVAPVTPEALAVPILVISMVPVPEELTVNDVKAVLLPIAPSTVTAPEPEAKVNAFPPSTVP